MAYKTKNAYGLPAGSIRALLAIIVFGSIWYLLAKFPTIPVPSYMQNLMFIIMGHYFASRGAKDKDPTEPNPLYLPKGSIRALLVIGFAVVAVLISYNQQWIVKGAMSTTGVSLILVGGFLIGIVVGQFSKTERRWVEDIRATISLAAAVTLLLIVFRIIHTPAEPNHFELFFAKIHYEEILAGVVGFYFGRKS